MSDQRTVTGLDRVLCKAIDDARRVPRSSGI